ncbi:SURF1 family protein [Corynebacterium lizhenjunii]|uniref:SURF1-like protein n=1 Tax=Corynebacterium lizhenjunii TaxID=2709394 RepID=A0A7T0KD48_9CORY|nr:SURF1 family protein [Corynebacterium lizhenjunii]QPK78563.1 SURF1 family protein [Corynebacterium lizhenjunii]
MWKAFLKPQWVLLTIFVVAFSYFAFTLLAPWQLGKDHDIVERNEHIHAAFEADPVPLQDAVDAHGVIADKEWTRVELHGHYLPDKEVLLRLRPVESGPTYQSLVPFRTDTGLTILVNRGWMVAGEANTVPEFSPAPSGHSTVVAMLRRAEGQRDTAPIEQEGYQQVYTITPSQIGPLIGLELATDYAQISHEGEPGVLAPIPLPQLERGSHLSYGFQWIAFGIMAPLGLAYFVFAEVRERRRLREEQAQLATQGSELADAPTPTESAPAQPAPNPARRSRSRYGDAKPDHYQKFTSRGRERF